VNRARRAATGVALLAFVAAMVVGQRRLTARLFAGGAPAAQRPLAGGSGGANPAVTRPVRVVLLDGLARADTARVPALARLCAGGLDLVVDVGFPTKSLPVQRVLWTGLNSQQLGDRGDNVERAPRRGAVPPVVGGVAVVEAFTVIARSCGFPRVEPPRAADSDDETGDRDSIAAWRAGFTAAAVAEVAGAAPLVMVHVLAIDEEAHGHGRRGPSYDAALAHADQVLGAVLAAAPDAQWLVLADHGHRMRGGHGDAEDEVRRVRACWSPAPVAAAAGTEVHLVDVARWLADALEVPRDPRSVGRTLAVAVAHPDRDATLPRAGTVRSVLAAMLLLTGLGAAVRASRSRVAALWPLAGAAIVLAVAGVPTLSGHSPTGLLVGVAAVGAALAGLADRRAGGPSATTTRITVAALGAIAGAVAALLVVTGVVQQLCGGPPALLPVWTALLAATTRALVGAAAGTGLVLLADSVLARRPGAAGS